MASLPVTTAQASLLTNEVNTYMDQAFGSGTIDPGNSQVVPKLDKYDTLTSAKTAIIKNMFKAVIAAWMVAFNIKRALPTGTTATYTLAKLTPGGANGSLTFTDGILTSYVQPT